LISGNYPLGANHTTCDGRADCLGWPDFMNRHPHYSALGRAGRRWGSRISSRTVPGSSPSPPHARLKLTSPSQIRICRSDRMRQLLPSSVLTFSIFGFKRRLVIFPALMVTAPEWYNVRLLVNVPSRIIALQLAMLQALNRPRSGSTTP
jgi:hypothetical protein